MQAYFGSRYVQDREDEFRRRADTYRMLAEVRSGEPRWRRVLSAKFGRPVPLPRTVRPWGRHARRPAGSATR